MSERFWAGAILGYGLTMIYGSLALVVAAYLTGCGAAVESDLCERYRCDPSPREFAPTPQAEGATRQALSRLARATGLDLAVDPSGLPVSFEPAVTWDGEEVCGGTLQRIRNGAKYPQNIEISTGFASECRAYSATVLHEMIHALAPSSEHAETGIYSVTADGETRDLLTRDTLSALCDAVDGGCAHRTPEVDE